MLHFSQQFPSPNGNKVTCEYIASHPQEEGIFKQLTIGYQTTNTVESTCTFFSSSFLSSSCFCCSNLSFSFCFRCFSFSSSTFRLKLSSWRRFSSSACLKKKKSTTKFNFLLIWHINNKYQKPFNTGLMRTAKHL